MILTAEQIEILLERRKNGALWAVMPDVVEAMVDSLVDLQSHLAAKDERIYELNRNHLKQIADLKAQIVQEEEDNASLGRVCAARGVEIQQLKAQIAGARLEAYERCAHEAAKNLYNGDEGAEGLRQTFTEWIALETPAGEKALL